MDEDTRMGVEDMTEHIRSFPLHGGFGGTRSIYVHGLAAITARVQITKEGEVIFKDFTVANDIYEWHEDVNRIAHDNQLATGQCCSHETRHLTEKDWGALEDIAEAMPMDIGFWEGALR